MRKIIQIFILILSIGVIVFCFFSMNDTVRSYIGTKVGYTDLSLEINTLENEISELNRFYEIITELATLYHSTDGTKVEEIHNSVELLDELKELQKSLCETNSEYSSLADDIDSLAEWREDALSYNKKISSGTKINSMVADFQYTLIANRNTIFEYSKTIIENYISIAEKDLISSNETYEKFEEILCEYEKTITAYIVCMIFSFILIIVDIIWIIKSKNCY